jgi:hypothetical protein
LRKLIDPQFSFFVFSFKILHDGRADILHGISEVSRRPAGDGVTVLIVYSELVISAGFLHSATKRLRHNPPAEWLLYQDRLQIVAGTTEEKEKTRITLAILIKPPKGKCQSVLEWQRGKNR